jgi:hypothetical protein
MPQPLVLRLGRIAEEIPAEAGTYPLLRLVAGRLVAGGPGADLAFVGGRIAQQAVAGDSMWDSGLTTWEYPVTWTDATWDAAWNPDTDWT